MIGASTISGGGRGLFIMSDIILQENQIRTLLPYVGPSYSWGDWHALVRYIRSMSTYALTANSLTSGNYGELQIIDGRPFTHQNVAGLINSSRGNSDATNCAFE